MHTFLRYLWIYYFLCDGSRSKLQHSFWRGTLYTFLLGFFFYVFYCFCLPFACQPVSNDRPPLQQLVSNISILPRNRKCSTGFFTSRQLCLSKRGRGHMLWASHWWKFPNSLTAHTVKRWRSALFHGGISFLIWLIHYQTWTHGRSQSNYHNVCKLS